jgi:type I restriction enzyme M protein
MPHTALIKALGFIPKENTSNLLYKQYANGYRIELDFESGKINYGDMIKSDNKTTQNFSQAENWVVLECVNRLLEKGYSPKNIILERTWGAGHGTSGRLDICVTRNDDSEYLLIECKTWGSEYDKELTRMKKDGGQLFTYFKFSNKADVLMLYSSKLSKDTIVYRNDIIKIEEDYRLGDVKDFYEKWNKLTKDNGLFESWVNPYYFASKALTLSQLKPIQPDDSGLIFNQFLEILRHNVVSDKPNAFNKIFTLFLCKVYDEKSTKPNQELAFQWLEGEGDKADDHIKFQLRLTDLYKKGMREFLKKTVTDFSKEDFEKKYGTLDESVKKDLLEEFCKLRLEKNNEFAIKEVFDQQSFRENAKIVKEVVELLQGFRLRYNKRQQYLSDFFELLLTTGLKQESGQFFTPVPIAQFIIKSLPLNQLVEEKLNKGERDNLLPYIMDYAAGSGHFLTESMHEIQRLLDNKKLDNYLPDTAKKIITWQQDHFDWAIQYVYGIEKDYRLVKVGKVGCYLHGDGLANVILSDGLANFTKTSEYTGILKHRDSDFPKENKQFDVVISNPPYSVSAFKNPARSYYGTDDFELYSKLTDSSSEIECLFIERTKQLLKDGGVAGIILPSSILSNRGVYSKAREIILQYFDIIAITELGSNTFMATGTNTVTLFLRRRSNYLSINLKSSLEKAIADVKDVTLNGIEKPISKYLAQVWDGISFEDYASLLKKSPNEVINEHELYQEYTKKLGDNAVNKIIELETEKLFYFILSFKQQCVLIKSGEKQTEKQFLGYEFSDRRGSEGIHPIHRGKNIEDCTQLFDKDVFDNPEKASTYIYQAFKGEFNTPIPESLAAHVFRVNLVDLFTFDRVEFEKSLSLSVKKKMSFEDIWSTSKLILLSEIAKIEKGKAITQAETIKGDIPVIAGGKSPAYFHNQSNREGNIITVSASGAYSGFVNYFDAPIFASDCNTIKSKNENIISTRLIYIFLKSIQNVIFELQRGQAQPHVYADDLAKIKIPLPPRDIQEKIVNEIEVLEAKEAGAKERIEKLKADISTIFNQNVRTENYRFSEIATLEYGKPLPKHLRIAGEYPVMGSNGMDGTHNQFLIEAPCIIVGRKGSAGKINYVQKNCFPIDTTFYVKFNANKINIKYLYFLLQELDLEDIAKGKGIGVPGLNRNNVHALKVSVHPIEEQQKIITQITAIENQITALENELATLPQQKAAVLQSYL